MRQKIVRASLVVVATAAVIFGGTSFLGTAIGPFHLQRVVSSAEMPGSTAIPTHFLSTATATPAPTTAPTPSPRPATAVTVTPTARSTPAPTPTPLPVTATPTSNPPATPAAVSVLEHGLVRQPNGMLLGCDPGLITQYLTCHAQEPQGFSMTFYFYLPRGYDAAQRYPLVLIMQGGGERAVAANPAWLNRVGVVANPYAQVFGPGFPEPYSEDVQAHWPSFVVIPQLINPARFVDVPAGQGSYRLARQPNDAMRMTKEIVDTLQLVFGNIDANRLYLTGLSMGGYGAWEAAERWPHYWAAVAPIAGGGDPSLAFRLVNVPIWAFHSSGDPVVPVSSSRDMIEAIREAGGNPRYTEFAEMTHGEWLAPYTILGRPSPTPDFFAWLFAQRR